MRSHMLDLLARRLGPASHAADGCDWWMPTPHVHVCLDSAIDGCFDAAAHVLIYDRYPRDGKYITEASPASPSEAATIINRLDGVCHAL